jgi:hypothetical protein
MHAHTRYARATTHTNVRLLVHGEADHVLSDRVDELLSQLRMKGQGTTGRTAITLDDGDSRKPPSAQQPTVRVAM